MSILVFVEIVDGSIKKSSREAISYAALLGKELNTTATALVLGQADKEDLESLGPNGAQKVLHVADERLNHYIIQAYATAVYEAMVSEPADIMVQAKSALSDIVAGRVAARLQAGAVTNVVSLPDLSSGFFVKRSIYTGKAFATVSIDTDKKILGIRKNTVEILEAGSKAEVVPFEVPFTEGDFATKITKKEMAGGDILLSEAELVVSGGRGLKGPENWGIVEELAKALGAALGCSKPVSDLGWRPHHEHVGQTGVKVSPDLYIAIGISGAIQHLAGVNSSKVLVAINTDPDAPFFSAADYGIVGDAFKVVPKLTEAVKSLKD